MAIPAFAPAFFCPGYLAGWFTNLHGFRDRSFVERIFWSLPLSLAIATIASVLLGKFVSLNAVALLLGACAACCIAVVTGEWTRIWRQGKRPWIGWHPLGGKAMTFAVLWIAAAILSLVDLQKGQNLFMNVAMLDVSYRVNWTNAILRTGIPPANPLYWFHQPAAMHNYYFWYVVCAAVVRMTHLTTRAVLIGGSVWAGFNLVALLGLYLKYFLEIGDSLRKQFLRAVVLLSVTGIDLCYIAWALFRLHQAPPPDLEAWSKDGIVSWLHTLLWAPHHLAAAICCMFAFLLAWMAGRRSRPKRSTDVFSIVFVAASLASAFGLSIYVTFAFFLVMIAWGAWQLFFIRAPKAPLILACGGVGAGILLLGYLWELTHTASGIHGSSPFGFAVREMIPPDGLLTTSLFQQLARSNPKLARSLAAAVLLVPGYAIELGFFSLVLLIYLVPSWRGKARLTDAHRSLLFIVVATIALMSVLRSDVLKVNDFGWRAALLVQFPLLLLGCELLGTWPLNGRHSAPETPGTSKGITPHWMRAIASLALVIGAFGTVCQALSLRFAEPLAERLVNPKREPVVAGISHNFYVSTIGFGKLNRIIPENAIVQPDPIRTYPYQAAADQLAINRQLAIITDQPWCGAELGGDPSGCALMAPAIDALFKGASAEQARATCRQFEIQYLVARVNDPAWNDRSGWVWKLGPVVDDPEFRVLECGR
ncbi:MAG TPA: hypothetical protein VKR52_06505 [Terracidiphilus sp.]|nr:hypothetical protein [Terracidiphilus sp.]